MTDKFAGPWRQLASEPLPRDWEFEGSLADCYWGDTVDRLSFGPKPNHLHYPSCS